LNSPISVSARALSNASPTVPTLGAAPAVARRSVNAIDVYCLGAGVGVMHQAGQVVHALTAAGPDRHLEGVQDQIGAHRGVRAPAEDAAGMSVDDERHVHGAGPGSHVGEVGHPQPVRPVGGEPPVDQIRRSGGARIRDRGARRRPRRAPCNPMSRISRSTVERATAIPSRLSCSHTLRAP
jgi:hypothetical protein